MGAGGGGPAAVGGRCPSAPLWAAGAATTSWPAKAAPRAADAGSEESRRRHGRPGRVPDASGGARVTGAPGRKAPSRTARPWTVAARGAAVRLRRKGSAARRPPGYFAC
ncbi:hypothetical protein GCM10010358_34880 [Streptomyces minutiscleroticus]|uniref:Uncharacterized protein n=1 Tax=Streptomyces minutiscleroticus TaxID=68238 RepID=A0A918KUY7_9ACTN|nr:hypothetical protein GCM10010358_34880 [Streptomyces minutiscleroticus]